MFDMGEAVGTAHNIPAHLYANVTPPAWESVDAFVRLDNCGSQSYSVNALIAAK
jgi:hypothetical protein